MNKFRDLIFYVGVIGIFSFAIYFILHFGANLEIVDDFKKELKSGDQWQNFLHSMEHNLKHPLAILLAQIVTILLTARIFSWLCRKIGQPTVIGEIIAGIVLGPSLLGMYFPEFTQLLFPKESLGNLQFLSQIGLILFMFVVGMELEIGVLKNRAHQAVVISHASIIFPFALGMGLAYFLYLDFAPKGIAFSSFALFLGIAMSITAFPVLARIVQERGLHKTRLGAIVITCAAADDITAWCLLAAVIAIVKAGTAVSAFYILAMSIVYVVIMLKVIRPFLSRLNTIHRESASSGKRVVAAVFITLIISSYLTEIIGIHALFGAFLTGAVMPDNMKFRELFVQKVEDVSLVLLLPLFFVFTGLRTQIGLLNDWHLWKITFIIIGIAIIGKFVGSALAARFVGEKWKDSLIIGALMNTRGLMELVVLNIGYDLGVLSPKIFAMMVIMALFTTFMTGPLIDLIERLFRSGTSDSITEINAKINYSVLVSFQQAEEGNTQLKIANALIRKQSDLSNLTVLHTVKSADIHSIDISEIEHDTLRPIYDRAKDMNQKITAMFKVSNDPVNDLIQAGNKGHFDLHLYTMGKSMYDGTLLGKILGFTTRFINPESLLKQVQGKESLFEISPLDDNTQQLLEKSEVPIGLIIDRGITDLTRINVLIGEDGDACLLPIIQRFMSANESQILITDLNGVLQNNPKFKEGLRSLEEFMPQHLHIQNAIQEDSNTKDLMVLSFATWKCLLEENSELLQRESTTLIYFEKP